MSARQTQRHPFLNQTKNKVEYHLDQFNKELSKYPILVHLEQHTQVPKTYAVLGALMLIIVFHTINPLAAPVSNLVGWALPAYLSFKALETPSPNDDIQWLTYWTVFGFFNFIESFAIRLVLYYVPWYYAFKTVFIIWLQLPAFRGAQATYLTVLKPVLLNISSQSHVVVPTTTTADAHQE